MRWFTLSTLAVFLWSCSPERGFSVASLPEVANPRVVGSYPGSDIYFNVPCPPYNAQLVAGHDQSMWTTDGNGDIVRIAMNGSSTLFSHPGILTYLTPNPDRNIYVAENYNGGGAIAKVTPQGQITDLPLPAGFVPAWIVSGSDGNLWITNSGVAGGLVRMTTPGVYTLFSNTLTSSPIGISRGPDKNVWVAVSGGLVRISIADGTPTFFPWGAGIRNAAMSQVNEGPDGGLWGADGKGVFYRMDALGGVTTYASGDPNQRFGETHGIPIGGPNKSLFWIDWFSNGNENVEFQYSIDQHALVSYYPGLSLYGSTTYTVGRDEQLWACNYGGTDVVIIHGIVTMPASVTLTVGSSTPLSVQEPHSTQHFFKAVSNDPNIATVTGTKGSFIVTGVSQGTTSITISDKIGNSVDVQVTVN